MTGVEIDMVVTDSLAALDLYERIFDIERVEVTDFPKGENEVIFSLYGVHFHMLDENQEFGMLAPDPDQHQAISFNVTVPDINETYAKAMNSGCTELQPVTDMPEYGVSNAMFSDPFGYLWMLHQVHKEVSFEERTRLWEEQKSS